MQHERKFNKSILQQTDRQTDRPDVQLNSVYPTPLTASPIDVSLMYIKQRKIVLVSFFVFITALELI